MNGDVIADVTKGVPAAFVTAVRAYIDRRQAPTMFIRALLGNALDDAMAYAPRETTFIELRASVRMVFNLCPGRARGSYAAVDAWLSGSTTAPEWPEVANGQA